MGTKVIVFISRSELLRLLGLFFLIPARVLINANIDLKTENFRMNKDVISFRFRFRREEKP
jgi:hypothetical protein